MKTIEVNYKIVPKEYDFSDPKIESNINGDELVSWRISKSLSDELLEKSASLMPEQLVIQYAEMQKRELQMQIEGLSDLELALKAKTDMIRQSLDSILDEQDSIWAEKTSLLQEKANNVKDFVNKSLEEIKPLTQALSDVGSKLEKINGYTLSQFADTMNKFVALQNENPKLFQFIIENFKN